MSRRMLDTCSPSGTQDYQHQGSNGSRQRSEQSTPTDGLPAPIGAAENIYQDQTSLPFFSGESSLDYDRLRPTTSRSETSEEPRQLIPILAHNGSSRSTLPNSVQSDEHTDDDHTATGRVQKPQQKRRPHTKSRNGCITCKKRRVKCDETRPTCRNCTNLRLDCRYATNSMIGAQDVQLMTIQLVHDYDCYVAQSIAAAGIGTEHMWRNDVMELAFKNPYLMHAVLMLAATHMSIKDPRSYGSLVVHHRNEALQLIRAEMQKPSRDLDALAAASVMLILDALANAAHPSHTRESSLPATAWIHHVRGAAAILLIVGTLPSVSQFHRTLGIDLLDLASCMVAPDVDGYSPLQNTKPELKDLYPLHVKSPYYASLSFLNKLEEQTDAPDSILRVFSFPALIDNSFIRLLRGGDRWARLIINIYYSIVRRYCTKHVDNVWFLRGVASVLPVDIDREMGGLGFIEDALPIGQSVEQMLKHFDLSVASASRESDKLSRENPLPSNFDEGDCHQSYARHSSQLRKPNRGEKLSPLQHNPGTGEISQQSMQNAPISQSSSSRVQRQRRNPAITYGYIAPGMMTTLQSMPTSELNGVLPSLSDLNCQPHADQCLAYDNVPFQANWSPNSGSSFDSLPNFEEAPSDRIFPEQSAPQQPPSFQLSPPLPQQQQHGQNIHQQLPNSMFNMSGDYPNGFNAEMADTALSMNHVASTLPKHTAESANPSQSSNSSRFKAKQEASSTSNRPLSVRMSMVASAGRSPVSPVSIGSTDEFLMPGLMSMRHQHSYDSDDEMLNFVAPNFVSKPQSTAMATDPTAMGQSNTLPLPQQNNYQDSPGARGEAFGSSGEAMRQFDFDNEAEEFGRLEEDIAAGEAEQPSETSGYKSRMWCT